MPPAPKRRLTKPEPAQEPVLEPTQEPARTPPEVPCVGLPFAINRYRVLFSDGDTIDFLSYSDHSGIRGEMLDAHYGPRSKVKADRGQDRIEGIAHLGQVYVHMPNVNWPDPPTA